MVDVSFLKKGVHGSFTGSLAVVTGILMRAPCLVGPFSTGHIVGSENPGFPGDETEFQSIISYAFALLTYTTFTFY
jgi:hypothetical protein